MKTYAINVSPMSDASDPGRDWRISAAAELSAVRIAQDRAEKLGIGEAEYRVSETRLSPTTAIYRTSGSAGRGYTLARVPSSTKLFS